MKLIDTLHLFSVYQTLLRKGIYHCSYTGNTIHLEENLFGEKTIFVNDKEYVILPDEKDEKLFSEVILPVLSVLSECEKYIIFTKSMNTKDLLEFETFRELLSKNKYSSDATSCYFKIQCQFTDHHTDLVFDFEELLNEMHDDIDLQFVITLESENDDFVLRNWDLDPTVRLDVITGIKENPNLDVGEELREYLTTEEAILMAKNDSLVSEFYSDFEKLEIAFNIKVYESFIHEELHELGILNYELEWLNRENAVENLMDKIFETADVNNWRLKGSSNGYLVIEFNFLTPEIIEEVSSIIKEAKKEDYKYYQSIEAYDYLYDEIIGDLNDLKEKTLDEDKFSKINNLLNELTIKSR